MFRVKIFIDGKEETIYSVISIESIKDHNNDDNIILRFDNGTGTIFEPDYGETFEVLWYER